MNEQTSSPLPTKPTSSQLAAMPTMCASALTTSALLTFEYPFGISGYKEVK